MIQIAQLLDERKMSFSFCLGKTKVLLGCSMTLLYQGLDLKQDSKMLKDNERLVNAAVKLVEQSKAPNTYDFKGVATLLLAIDDSQNSPSTPPRQSPVNRMAAPAPQRSSPIYNLKKKSPRHHLSQDSLGRQSGASMSEADLLLQQEKLRRVTMPSSTPDSGTGRTIVHRSASRTSFDSVRPNPASILQRRDHRLSTPQSGMIARVSSGQETNLDYLPLNNSSAQPGPSSPVQNSNVGGQSSRPGTASQQLYTPVQIPQKAAASPSEWEALLGQIDGGQVNLYDAIYGGPQVSLETPAAASTVEGSWSPGSLDLSTFNIGGLAAPQSLSEESLSSASGADDVPSMEFRDLQGNRRTMMPAGGGDRFMDGSFVM